MQAAFLHGTCITQANRYQYPHTCIQKFTVFKYNFPILYIKIMSKYCVKVPNYHLNMNITRVIVL